MSASAKTSAASGPPGLPLAVQLSFAGSRFLFDPQAHPGVSAAEFHDAVQRYLTERLCRLAAELGLSERHFFCGLSQLAIGADTLFSQACRELGWPQRLFLSQQREEFLAAIGSQGLPDFTEPQRQQAHELFVGPHVIQERVVGDSPDRRARFQDVNRELVRVGDLVVCLVAAAAAGKSGGTRELIDDAQQRNRPLLEMRVAVGPDGQPQFTEEWRQRERFALPRLPRELAGLRTGLTGIPSMADYCRPLKEFASRMARWQQTLFKYMALVIIGTHLLATLCAVIALKLHGVATLPWLLAGELLLLGTGFCTHQYLHHSHAAGAWAMARLAAEMARSGLALRQVPGYLRHLFSLPLPASLLPLLRTLNVLHLRETRPLPAEGWQQRRQSYVENRLTTAQGSQIRYYEVKLAIAEGWHRVASWAFLIGSGCAFAATLGKLLLVCDCLPGLHERHDAWAATLGTLAIILPVVAVAALSLGASFDLQARVQTYREMLEFLRTQVALLNQAPSERAFSSLAMETETRLLGETATWHSRRSSLTGPS